MTKHAFLLFAVCLGFSATVWAQKAQELMITFDKKTPPTNAIQLTLPGTSEGAEEVMYEKVRRGSANKPKKEGSVMVVRGVVIPEISQLKMDYSYRIDKANVGSTITLYLSLGNNNYVRSDVYPQEIENAKKFLESIDKELRIFDQEKSVKDQADALKKEESKLKDLEKDAADLDKKLKELQKDIEVAGKKVSDQSALIQAAKAKLQEAESALKAMKQ